MGFKGDLSTFNLANIFQTLSMNRQSGTLSIFNKQEAFEAYVYFHDGQIRQVATSDTKRLRIGEVLLRIGLISADTLEKALTLQKTTREKLGDIFVRSGAVTHEQIVRALQFQQEEILYDLFSWEQALFEFTDNEKLEKAFNAEVFELNIAFNTNSVMMEAMRRLDEWNRIRNFLPSENEIPVQAVPLTEEGIDQNYVSVYNLANGINTAKKICALSYLGKFTTFQILAELVRDGYLRLKDVDELIRTGQDCLRNGYYEDCISVLGLVLSQEFWEPVVVRNLADAYVAIGDNDKAAEKIGELVEFYRASASGTRPSDIRPTSSSSAKTPPTRTQCSLICSRIPGGRARRSRSTGLR
jgi:hypothetical protein